VILQPNTTTAVHFGSPSGPSLNPLIAFAFVKFHAGAFLAFSVTFLH
jgi:hypothetical protein